MRKGRGDCFFCCFRLAGEGEVCQAALGETHSQAALGNDREGALGNDRVGAL